MTHADTTVHALQERTTPSQFSLDEYWMPFTPNRDFRQDPKMVVRAEGMYLWNDHGDKILDGSSGLFCVNAGHGRREIADAVGAQLRELDFIAPFTRGHPKQFQLATRVAELTPGDWLLFFFAHGALRDDADLAEIFRDQVAFARNPLCRQRGKEMGQPPRGVCTL